MNGPDLKMERVRKTGFGLGFVCLAACGVWLAVNPRALAVSYLWSFLFWFGLALGCLNAAMMHYLAAGRWGELTRRFFEAGYMTLPVLALLFIPILFNLRVLYPWATVEGQSDPFVQKRAHYENSAAFILRAFICFGVWTLFAVRLRKWSLKQDATAEFEPTAHLQTLSGPGLVVVNLAATFAFVDWIMSAEDAWFSTMFAVIVLAGEIVLALAFCTALLCRFAALPPFKERVETRQFRDLGGLLLAFVMFWTYVAFSQLLIIYSGNQPHEISWYLHRIAGDWKWLLALVALFHFFVPFFLLLFRPVKDNASRLAKVCVLLFLIHILNSFWVVAPTFYRAGIRIHWTDFAAWLGIGGIWAGTFLTALKNHPLLARTIPGEKMFEAVHSHAQ